MAHKIKKCIVSGMLSLSILAGSGMGAGSILTTPFSLTAYAGRFAPKNPGGRHDIFLGTHSLILSRVVDTFSTRILYLCGFL